MDKEELHHQIARELDKPSLYMGGPSFQSLRTATKIIKVLERAEANNKDVKIFS